MSLTKKQQLFVDAYLIDPNGKKAAIAAGYAEGSAAIEATRLLKHAAVRGAIDAGQKLLSVRAGVTPEMVIAELAKVGFSDIRQIIEWRAVNRQLFDGDGEPVDVPELVIDIKDSDSVTPEAAAALAEVSRTKDGTVKIKMHDKLGALVRIGHHLGMFRTPVAAEEPGKKDRTALASKTAESGTSWDGLLQ